MLNVRRDFFFNEKSRFTFYGRDCVAEAVNFLFLFLRQLVHAEVDKNRTNRNKETSLEKFIRVRQRRKRERKNHRLYIIYIFLAGEARLARCEGRKRLNASLSGDYDNICELLKLQTRAQYKVKRISAP